MSQVRRPLCLCACVFLAVAFLLLRFIPVKEAVCEDEGNVVTLSGVLVRKEVKRTYLGEVVPVYYVKTKGERTKNSKKEKFRWK